VREGGFRADLFYRLSTFPIVVPPLRARREDIPLLATRLLQRTAERFHRAAARFTPAALARLCAYDWPGNVRELQNIVERAVILATGPTLEIGPDLLGTDKRVGRESPLQEGR